MRLFVAIYPPPAALDHFEAALGRLRLGAAAATGGSVGLTDRARWHVTLAFLGDLPAEQVPAAESAVSAGVSRWREPGAPAPTLRLAGAGRFGRDRFTVLWVGLAGDLTAFTSLGQAVRRELRRHKVPYDGKPLRPHLTFARPTGRLPEPDLAADLAELARYEGPAWPVEAVHLMRSHLGPRPWYEQVATAPLPPARRS